MLLLLLLLLVLLLLLGRCRGVVLQESAASAKEIFRAPVLPKLF